MLWHETRFSSATVIDREVKFIENNHKDHENLG